MFKRKSFYFSIFCLIVFFIPNVVYSQDNHHNKSNIIIITIDSLRADHVGCYGYYRNTTPNIDKFSQDAIIFRNVLSQYPSTQGSMGSFITGIYPHLHAYGYKNFSGPSIAALNPGSQTLAQVLGKLGYTTAFFSDFIQLFYINSLEEGFDYFEQICHSDPPILTQGALEIIDNIKDENLFLWVHYFGPHYPYYPNKKELLKTPLKRKDKDISLAKKSYDVFNVIPLYSQLEDKKNINFYIDSYDGKIRFVDEWVGKFIDGIKEMGLYEDSLIIITSDHGEEFGEHNLYCDHAYNVYNTLLKVPLAIKFPGNIHKQEEISQYVGLIDVMPTILDFIGVSKKGLTLQGKSFLDILDSNKKEEINKQMFVYSECSSLYTCVVFDRYKFIANNLSFLPVEVNIPEYELYDLKKDPYEQNNLANISDYKEIFKFLKDKLNEFNQNKNEIYTAWRVRDDEEERFDDDLEILRSLGYIQ